MKYAWLEFAKVTSSALVVWTSILLAAPAAAQSKADPLDWPYWRGPEYNSISRETGLPDTINPDGGEGSNLAWKRGPRRPQHTDSLARQALHNFAS